MSRISEILNSPEFFREPDAGIFGLSYTVSMGQWLSLPMILAGIAMFAWSRRRR